MNSPRKTVIRPESIGKLNKSLVLKQIRLHGPISRAEIARKTGLSKPSVSRSINILLRENLILREGTPEVHEKIGRKPEMLRFNNRAAFFISIDIGGTKITFGIGDLSGEILKEYQIENPHSWDEIVKLIFIETKKLLKSTKISYGDLKGVAVAAQGVVKIDEGTVTSAPNIMGPREYPLRDKLKEYLQTVPLWIENDVNLSAMGEFWRMQEKYKNIVYISIGTVIGGAIIINGKLFRGKNYYAGEIGWFIPDRGYLFKELGEFGCLERLATGPALVEKTRRIIQKGYYKDDFLISNNSITPRKIFNAYKKGSVVAKQVVKEWIENLGITICNISSLLNPELVILEGGLTRSGGFFLKDLRRIVQWGCQVPPEIKISTLQHRAPLYGGLKLCIDNFLKEI